MTIVEADRLSLLIGRIYDAAVDSSQWSDALELVADFVGGCSAALVSRDAAKLTIEVHHDFGADSYFRQLFRDRFADRDPVLTSQIDVTADQTISVTDVMPYALFLESIFYRKWVAPQGVVDIAAVVVEKSDTRTTLLWVLRHEGHGFVDEATRERMRLVAPHIRRSTIMGRKIDADSRSVTDLARALDGLSTAICLLDRDRRVVRANTACRRLFADADLMTTIGGRIVACSTPGDRMLRSLLGKEDDEVVSGVHNQVESLKSARGVHYLARVLALNRDFRPLGDSTGVAASVLFVQKASIATSFAADVVAGAFRLTPSELRVLIAIVEIGGVPEVAKTFGVADTTVKTHLSRLFEKMGVSRQADLVKVVAGFSTPFAQHTNQQ
jgi:DNA-binding CsgD family transcriptional regulator